jgi:photosystem II stability/assembly factor-like uncharacterized protein
MIGGTRNTEATRTGRVKGAAWGLAGLVALGCGCTNSADSVSLDASANDSSVTVPGGMDWTPRASLTGADFRTVWGSGDDVFAAGVGDAIAHSGDRGDTWTTVVTGLTLADGWPKVRHIGGSSGTDAWIVGSTSAAETILLHSADHGQSWQPRAVPDARDLQAVWAIDASRVFLADHDGDVFSSADGGTTWSRKSLGTGIALFGLWGSGAQELYAVGARGGDVASDAGAAEGADAGAATAATLTGVMFHSPDGGQTWTEIDVSPTGPLWKVSGTPDGQKVYAAGAGASLAWTADHGATWTARSRLGALDLADVWVAPGDGALFFATQSGLVVDIEYQDSGSAQLRYESLPAGDDGSQSIAAIWGRGSGDAWAVGPGGTLRHRQ